MRSRQQAFSRPNQIFPRKGFHQGLATCHDFGRMQHVHMALYPPPDIAMILTVGCDRRTSRIASRHSLFQT